MTPKHFKYLVEHMRAEHTDGTPFPLFHVFTAHPTPTEDDTDTTSWVNFAGEFASPELCQQLDDERISPRGWTRVFVTYIPQISATFLTQESAQTFINENPHLIRPRIQVESGDHSPDIRAIYQFILQIQ